MKNETRSISIKFTYPALVLWLAIAFANLGLGDAFKLHSDGGMVRW